ncbi:MAG: hypothetical protein ACFE75_11260 [Candidatus Hodarchaeota archaeon]
MAKLQIRCPICSQWEQIEISDDATKNVSKGLLAINIATGMICDHSFIAYVDKNLIVRDCLVADFKIELPESASSQETEEIIKPETETIKFDLIKVSIPEFLMTYIIKSIFEGKKTLIISEEEFLYNHLKNFFKYIMQNSFNFDITVMASEDYKKNKQDYKEHLIFNKREVIRDKDKIIDPKKLNTEKAMVQKFFDEYDLMAGLIILRNEINKAYGYSKTIAEYAEKKKGKPITSKILIDHILEKYGERIQIPYLNFLINIVQNYFKVEIPKIGGVTDLLGFL